MVVIEQRSTFCRRSTLPQSLRFVWSNPDGGGARLLGNTASSTTKEAVGFEPTERINYVLLDFKSSSSCHPDHFQAPQVSVLWEHGRDSLSQSPEPLILSLQRNETLVTSSSSCGRELHDGASSPTCGGPYASLDTPSLSHLSLWALCQPTTNFIYLLRRHWPGANLTSALAGAL